MGPGFDGDFQSGDVGVLTGFYRDDKTGITSTFKDFKAWFLEPR